MKDFLKKYKLNVISAFCCLVVALFWVALRVNWSGISKVLGADTNPSFFVMQTPLLICIFLWLAFLFSVISPAFFKDKKFTWITSFAISFVFAVGIVIVVIFGAYDYLQYILPKFWSSLVVSVAIILFAGILFFPLLSNCKKCVALKSTLIVLIILFGIFVGYDVKGNYFTYDAVVYAVEDEYQIVFSTNDNSVAWVEIDGENYYELYAGSMKSNDLVHKVTVPQSVLDSAKHYTICAEQMIYRGPFGGYKGKVITREHSFRPVDTSDGLEYYAMSDIHNSFKGAVDAASYHKDMDFLILLGDITSMVEYESDAQFVNKVAYAVTNGEFPVVYARGNHEVKGKYAEELYKYVGSKNGSFYYTFTLENVFGLVLDLGEDHDDGWWEYYGTDHFTLYHQEQTAFMQQCIDNNVYDGYKYRMALCHIPVTFVNSRGDHVTVKRDMTALLNEMNIDIFLSGHQHDLNVFEPSVVEAETRLTYNAYYKGEEGKQYGKKGYLTNFNFPGFITSRCALTQLGDTQVVGTNQFTGLFTSVDFTSKKETSSFTNSNGEKVPAVNMWAPGEPRIEFVFDLKTK